MHVAIPIVEPTRPMTSSMEGISRAMNREKPMMKIVIPRKGPSGMKVEDSYGDLVFNSFIRPVKETYLLVDEGEDASSARENN